MTVNGTDSTRRRINGQPVPAAPSSLTATAASSSQIDLEWTDNASDETGFSIERKAGAGSFAEIATPAANATTYSDTGLDAETEYTYRMRAVRSGVYSAYSNEASDTTEAESGGLPAQESISLWLKADAGTFQNAALTTPASSDNDAVGGWQDQSGEGNHALDSSPGIFTNAATLKLNIQNGLPAIRFDGSEDTLLVDNYAGEVWTAGSGVKMSLAMAFALRATDGFYWLLGEQDNIAFSGGEMSFSAVAGTASFAYAGTAWHTLHLVFDGTQASYLNRVKIWLDGVAQSLDFAGDTFGDSLETGLFLAGAWTNPAPVDFGEIVYWKDVALTTEQVGESETYLNGRWATH